MKKVDNWSRLTIKDQNEYIDNNIQTAIWLILHYSIRLDLHTKCGLFLKYEKYAEKGITKIKRVERFI